MARESPWKVRWPRGAALGAVALATLAAGCAKHANARAAAPPAAHHASARKHDVRVLPANGNERLTYAVRVDPGLARIHVEVCPSGFRIERLEAPSPGAQELLGGDPIITPEGNYACPTDGVDLPLSKPGDCVQYSVQLPEKTPDPTSTRRVDSDVLASPDLWLWVPMPRPLGVPMRVHFTLPVGVVAAVPWPKAGEDFTLSESAFAWKAGGAFTHRAPEALPAPGAELTWAPLGAGFSHADAIRDWLADGARASSLLFGHFPVPNALVIGVPGEGRRSSFGMALRGGGPAVVILLDRAADARALASDWTCTHEFLHLGVPRLPPEDAWLFEGLATYYTELVRARAGIITPVQAYQHLLEGFERGRKNAGPSTLRQASAEMRQIRAFYRVYWSGAALAFLTDVAARRAGGTTLDAALRAFADCCATSEHAWDAEQVLARLDEALGTPRFAPLAKAWLDRTEFPDVNGVLAELGVSPGPRGAALFQHAPGEAIRDGIMEAESDAHADGEPHQRK